jgi:hypothetical protein
VSNFWRRRIGGVLLSLGLMAAAFGYGGLILRGIVTDDGVATRAASAALHDDQVRAFLADQTASAVGDQLLGRDTIASLEAFGIDPQPDLDAIAQTVLADPRFEVAFVDTVRALHRSVLVESGPPPVVDVTALVGVARDAAVARNSAYAALFPAEGTLRVAVPTDDLPDLSGATQSLGDRARLATIVAVVLVTAGMLVHANRPKGLRRIGTWAIGTAVVQGALALALPVAAARVPGDLRGVAEAVAETLRPRLLVPAAMLGAVGVALVAAAWRWKRAQNRAREERGAQAFLGEDPFAPAAAYDGQIELASHRSPMGAPPVPLATGHGDGADRPRDEYSPLPGSSVFGDSVTAREPGPAREVSPPRDVLPTTPLGG